MWLAARVIHGSGSTTKLDSWLYRIATEPLMLKAF
jgi:hypothetical protein